MLKKTKKTIKIFAFLSLVLVLSGCSVVNKPQGGFFKSVDGGQTFFQEEGESGQILSGVNILSMEINPNNLQEIFVGTTDAGLFKTVDEGRTWLADVNGFENIHDIDIIPGTNTIYMVAQKDGLGKLFKSENNGEKWVEVYNEKDQSSYLTAVATNKNNRNIVYITSSKGGVFKSEDGGETWKNLHWVNSVIKKIELDKINSNVIYLATTKNGLIRSRDGGESFESIINSGLIYNVLPHPNREGFVYASTKGGLMRSLNYGDDWDTLNTLVQPEEVVSHGIAVNPQNPNKIYFTSGMTFYKSANEGKTWSTEQFNPSNSIETIRINSENPQKIYLGANKNNKNNFQFNPFLN